MTRPPIGPETMRFTVKFRLSDSEMEDLRDIASGDNISEALRDLIRNEKKRRARRDRRKP